MSINLKACSSCDEPRGNRRTDWTPTTGTDGQVTGWTCPTCPAAREPIRMIVTKSGRVRFRVVVDGAAPGQPRKQITRTVETLAAARSLVEEVRQAVVAGDGWSPSGGTGSGVTFREIAEQWLASRRSVREVTRRGYRSELVSVNAIIGDRPVASLTRPDIDALVQQLSNSGGVRHRPLGHRAVAGARTRTAAVLRYAQQAGLVAENVAEGVEVPRERRIDREEMTVWTPEELVTFRAAADQDRLAGAWRLTLCGLRRSEVLGLIWDDVDLEAGTVAVRASRVIVGVGERAGETERDDEKSGASRRTVPVEDMQPGTVALLKSLKAQQAADRLAAGTAWQDSGLGLVVVNEVGEGIYTGTYGDWFGRLCVSAGVPVVRLHAVRHTIATALHSAGVAPADAAELLGHTLAVHLSTYVKASRDGTSRAAAAAGRLFAAAADG